VVREVSRANLVKSGKTLEKSLMPFPEEAIVRFSPDQVPQQGANPSDQNGLACLSATLRNEGIKELPAR